MICFVQLMSKNSTLSQLSGNYVAETELICKKFMSVLTCNVYESMFFSSVFSTLAIFCLGELFEMIKSHNIQFRKVELYLYWIIITLWSLIRFVFSFFHFSNLPRKFYKYYYYLIERFLFFTSMALGVTVLLRVTFRYQKSGKKIRSIFKTNFYFICYFFALLLIPIVLWDFDEVSGNISRSLSLLSFVFDTFFLFNYILIPFSLIKVLNIFHKSQSVCLFYTKYLTTSFIFAIRCLYNLFTFLNLNQLDYYYENSRYDETISRIVFFLFSILFDVLPGLFSVITTHSAIVDYIKYNEVEVLN